MIHSLSGGIALGGLVRQEPSHLLARAAMSRSDIPA